MTIRKIIQKFSEVWKVTAGCSTKKMLKYNKFNLSLFHRRDILVLNKQTKNLIFYFVLLKSLASINSQVITKMTIVMN